LCVCVCVCTVVVLAAGGLRVQCVSSRHDMREHCSVRMGSMAAHMCHGDHMACALSIIISHWYDTLDAALSLLALHLYSYLYTLRARSKLE